MKFKKFITYPLYKLILEPLIKKNYHKRKEGKLPDKWHWADELGVRFGHFTSISTTKKA